MYRDEVAKILLVSDASVVLDEVRAVVDNGEHEISELRSGEAVREFVAAEPQDLVITDCQVQNMGGIAICHDLRLEESGGRQLYTPVLILLDRRADTFLVRHARAEGYLIKPLDPVRIRRSVETLLAGGTFYDESYKPFTVTVPQR